MFNVEELSQKITGRPRSLFAPDIAARGAELGQVAAQRVLVIGGAGSIGSATVRALLRFRPLALHIVDHNENGLAELVRDLRSASAELPEDFRTLPLDFGSPLMERFLVDTPSYDVVFNFAALKHVRSEKDSYSLLQILDTNVIKQARFLEWLSRSGARRYFCVSTDKAANPVNLMGASKRLLEHVLFSGAFTGAAATASGPVVTSARFANVAFSDGSLLDSFLRRIAKRQPLAAPRSTRRYFISLEEAGQICLLAGLLAPDRRTLAPRLDPGKDLIELEAVARTVLAEGGYEARTYDDEASARRGVLGDVAAGKYPLLLTPLDTSGEKPYEEFVGDGESTSEVGLKGLLAVDYRPAPGGAAAVAALVGRLAAWIGDARGRTPSKSEVVAELGKLIPEFAHIETGKHLDQRM